MAKLSANGHKKVGQVTVTTKTGRYIFALRSDGAVLRRIAAYADKDGTMKPTSGNYSVYGKMNGAGTRQFTASDVDRLAHILKIKGFRKVEIK